MQTHHKRNQKTRYTLLLSVGLLTLGLGSTLMADAVDREAQLLARTTALEKLSRGEVGTADLDITLRQLRKTGSLRFAWRDNAEAAKSALDIGRHTDAEEKAQLRTFLGYSLGCRGQYQEAMLNLRRVPESSKHHEEALNLEIRYARKLDLLPTTKSAAIKFMTRYPDSVYWDEVYKNFTYCYRVYQLKAGRSYMFYGNEDGLQTRYTRRKERAEDDPPPFSEPLSQEVIEQHHNEIDLVRAGSHTPNPYLLDYAELLLESGQNDFRERLESFARVGELQTPKWRMRIWLAKVHDAAQRAQQEELDAVLLERPEECRGADLDRLALVSLDDPTLEHRFKYRLARAFYEKAVNEEMRARTLAIATVQACNSGMRNEEHLLERYDKLVLKYPNHPWTLYARVKANSDVFSVRRELDRENASKRTRVSQVRADRRRRTQEWVESIRSLRDISTSDAVELRDDEGLYQEGCWLALTEYLDHGNLMLRSDTDGLLEACNLVIENCPKERRQPIVNAYMSRALWSRANGQQTMAIEDLQSALETWPDNRRLKRMLKEYESKKAPPARTPKAASAQDAVPPRQVGSRKAPPARIPEATQAQDDSPPIQVESSASVVLSVTDEVMQYIRGVRRYTHEIEPQGWSEERVHCLMNVLRSCEINAPDTANMLYVLKYVATPACEDGIVAFYGRLRNADDVGFLESDMLLYEEDANRTETKGYSETVRNTLRVLERIGSDRCIRLIEEALDQSLWVDFLKKNSDAKEKDNILFDRDYLSEGIVRKAIERLVAADTELSRAMLKKGWSGPQHAYANEVLEGIRQGTYWEPALRSYRPR